MEKNISRIRILVCAACFSLLFAFAGFAADVITSVSLRVDSEIEAGDTLPDISIAENGGTSAESGKTAVSSTSDRYTVSEAKWVTSTLKTMEVGDQPEMKILLEPTDKSAYYFKGSYRSGNISIRGGSFVSASVTSGKLQVRLRINPIKGAFEEPVDAYWKDDRIGIAVWEKDDEDRSRTYEVALRRGSSTVFKAETSSTTYNLYPYMTSAGTYTFRVRTIGGTDAEKKYGTKSEWVESEEFDITQDEIYRGSVDGGGSGSGSNRLTGWQYRNGSWYYYDNAGNYQRDNWLLVGNQWYLFDGNGKMLTGWQNKNGYTYYLADNGAMQTGWIRGNNRWYYLNGGPNLPYGAMMSNSWLNLDGKIYYLMSDGTMAEGWLNLNGSWYYLYADGNYQRDSWLYVGNSWYLFQSDGRMLTGRQDKNGHTYFLADNGAMQTGWVKWDNRWYYMNTGGNLPLGAMMKTAWLNLNGKYYFLQADGTMAEGWSYINGAWYLFQSDGTMLTGWQNPNGKWYYLWANGTMAEGWTELSGKWYYFYPGTGNRAENTTVDGYVLDENGVRR